ncbi:MAG TPA: HNH endonuclease [Actinomycetales bacterium]|nr:HNH endonuclease [Actinomycetales bacterium]
MPPHEKSPTAHHPVAAVPPEPRRGGRHIAATDPPAFTRPCVPATSATLLLNASFEPLCVVSTRRAVVLVLSEKAVPLEFGAAVLHSARCTITAPTVVLLSRYVRVPYRRGGGAVTRRAVLHRDHHRCAYCGGKADTVDHVVPRSRGGRHEWTNVVAACLRCNGRKADHLLGELGWTLAFAPSAPDGLLARVVGLGSVHPAWEPYLAYGRHPETAGVGADELRPTA